MTVPAAVITDPCSIPFHDVNGTCRGALNVGALPDRGRLRVQRRLCAGGECAAILGPRRHPRRADHSIFGKGEDASDKDGGIGTPAIFKTGYDPTGDFDRPSDSKGPEQASPMFGEIDGKPYLLAGPERASLAAAFDISSPSAPIH